MTLKTESELIALCSTGYTGLALSPLQTEAGVVVRSPRTKWPFVLLCTTKASQQEYFLLLCVCYLTAAAWTLTCAIRITGQHQRIRPLHIDVGQRKIPNTGRSLLTDILGPRNATSSRTRCLWEKALKSPRLGGAWY